MEQCKPLSSLGVKASEEDERSEDHMAEEEARKFRRAVATLNYMCSDRVDLSFATKELARRMARPRRIDGEKLKRVLRYLQGAKRGVLLYRWQQVPCQLKVFTDSDWAGCVRTRRSTSGGTLMHGAHCLLHWARTQRAVALSSGEAELNGALKGGVEILGANTLMQEMGLSRTLLICGDSSACKGTLSREGIGKLKHVSVKQLWLQEHVANGTISLMKIPRDINLGDVLTKHWGPGERHHFRGLGFRVCGM